MKNKRKVKVFFTIDPDLYIEFEKHIDDKLLDKSHEHSSRELVSGNYLILEKIGIKRVL